MTPRSRRNRARSSRATEASGVPFAAGVAGLSILAGAVTWHVAPMVETAWAASSVEAASAPVGPVVEVAPPILKVPQPVADTVHYSGCRAVGAAGAAPLRRRSPGYRPERVGDGDGIACEDHGESPR